MLKFSNQLIEAKNSLCFSLHEIFFEKKFNDKIKMPLAIFCIFEKKYSDKLSSASPKQNGQA